MLKIFATKRNCFPRLGPFLKTTSALCIHRLGRDQVPQSPFVSVFRPIFHIEISFSLSLQQIYHKYSLLFRIKSPPEITQGRKTKKKFHKHFSFFRIFSRISRKKKEKIPLQRFINLYSTPINPIPVSLLIRSRYRNFLFLLFSRRHIAVPPTLSQ